MAILPAHHSAQCYLFRQALAEIDMHQVSRGHGPIPFRLSDLRNLWRFYEARARLGRAF
jgi:hypothetical protein